MKHTDEEKSNQIQIKGWKQDKINNAAVAVFGLGAIGSKASVNLARLGVGKIIAVDYDTLELHNIENQMYTMNDLGKTKVIALKQIISDIDSDIKFDYYCGKIRDAPQKVFEAGYYFGCLDNPAARFLLNSRSIRYGRPFIDGGIEGFTGSVRAVMPGKTPCLNCQPLLIPESGLRPCSENKIPSTFIIASHAADLMVMELINILFEWKVEPYLYFDLKNNICKPIPLRINPDCITCGVDFYGKDNL